MKKKLISLLLVLSLLCSVMPMASAASPEARQAADALHANGLFNGTGVDANGKPIFELDRAPTRHEAVTMLVRLLGKEAEAKAGTWETPFTDVAEWAKPYVGYAYANGLTNGTSETTYGGEEKVTASQYLTFVLRALGYDSAVDFQWDKAWELSDAIGMTDGRYNAQTQTFLRGDVAIISRSTLETEQKAGGQTLAQKLIEEGVFTQAAYDKANEPPVILKMETDATKYGIPYTYEINGEIYSALKGFRAEAGTYVVRPFEDGVPISNYTVEAEWGSGSVVKNADGTFTVSFPAKDTLTIALWFEYEHKEINDKGEEETFYSRGKTNFHIAEPIPKTGFVLDLHGENWLPVGGFGDNYKPFLVMNVYYNGVVIDDYTVTAASGAPFTVSVQADGTLLLMKTGRGQSTFTVTYQGQSATFRYNAN